MNYKLNGSHQIKFAVTSYAKLISSYRSIFRLVGSLPSGTAASHSFHCCINVRCCDSGKLLRGLPTAFFPNIAPSRMFTTNSLYVIVRPFHERRLFFFYFKNNLSFFAVWKLHHSLFPLYILSLTFFSISMFQMHL